MTLFTVEQDGPDFYILDSRGDVIDCAIASDEYSGADVSRLWFEEVAAPAMGLYDAGVSFEFVGAAQ